MREVEPHRHAGRRRRGLKFSMYCALEEATKECTGEIEHHGAALQEAAS